MGAKTQARIFTGHSVGTARQSRITFAPMGRSYMGACT